MVANLSWKAKNEATETLKKENYRIKQIYSMLNLSEASLRSITFGATGHEVRTAS